MSDNRPLAFRSGNTLSTAFTGTLSERYGGRVERISTPSRLGDWFRENGLPVDECTSEELLLAHELREAIHHAFSHAARASALPESAVRIINERCASGCAAAQLDAYGQRTWRLTEASSVMDALGVIAADSITILSGGRPGRIAICSEQNCQAAFFDESRSHTRKWCNMNTCGNRQKKARLRSRQA